MTSIDVGYPVFAARFKNENKLVIGGGGGEGKNGIKNKITVINVESDNLSIDKEIELSENDDNPTSLAVKGDVVYAGVNRNMASVQQGKNDHLRVLNLKEKKQKKSHSIMQDDSYQKCTCIYGNQLAIASSAVPGNVHVLNTRSMKIKFSRQIESEINDISFSPDGKRLLCVSDKNITVFDSTSGKVVTAIEPPQTSGSGISFAKARYINDDEAVVAVLNKSGRSGAVLALYNNDYKLAKTQPIAKIRAVTAMDASENFVAVAASDLSVIVFNSTSLKQLTDFKNVHEFAVTDVVISDDERSLVTVSAANTVHLIVLPQDGKFHGQQEALMWALISVILLILTALVFQFVVKRQLMDSLQGLKQQQHKHLHHEPEDL